MPILWVLFCVAMLTLVPPLGMFLVIVTAAWGYVKSKGGSGRSRRKRIRPSR